MTFEVPASSVRMIIDVDNKAMIPYFLKHVHMDNPL